MADFDLEQLKTIMENLGDRLEKTKGDQLSRDELYRIRTILNKMSSSIGKRDDAATDRKTIVQELVKEMRKAGIKKPTDAASPTARRGTIINEAKARRQGGQDGNTILDQILRKAGKEANEFSVAVNHAGNSTKTFSDRMKTSGAAIGAAATASTVYLKAFVGAGAERVDLYRQLLASGEGTVSSMQDMGRQASAAGMTVKDFVEAMTNGTQGARQLGAIKFGDVRRSLLEMTRASGYMSMLPEQITEVTSTYAEILRLQGSNQNRSSEEMAKGILSLVQTSETTAHILGLSREDALKAQADLARDMQLNAVLRAKGLDAETARAAVIQVESVAGQSGKDRLLDQLTFGQAGPSSAAFQAVSPEIGNAIASIGDKVNAGIRGSDLLFQSAGSLKQAGSVLANDSGRLESTAQIARLNGGGLGSVLTDVLQGTLLSQGLNSDGTFNAGSNQNQNKEQKAATGFLQASESLYKTLVTADSGITMVFNPMVNVWGPKMRDDILPAMDAFNQKLQEGAIDASQYNNTIAGIATTAIAVAGGLALFGASLALITKGGIIKRVAGAIFGGLGGAGAGAGAGAGGAGAAGGAFKSAAKILGKTAAVGSVLEAGSYAFGDKDLTFKNLAKSGLAIGGGALGALGGGLLTGGIGTAVGGVGGYMGGAALGDWLLGPDDLKSQVSAPTNTRAGSPKSPTDQRNTMANATGQKGKSTLSMDQMTTKIMEASERSANLLKQIKDNSDKHLEAVREETAVIRAMSDRMSRLLQEGNKHTKSIVDHSI